jgi:hypothetical protein
MMRHLRKLWSPSSSPYSVVLNWLVRSPEPSLLILRRRPPGSRFRWTQFQIDHSVVTALLLFPSSDIIIRTPPLSENILTQWAAVALEVTEIHSVECQLVIPLAQTLIWGQVSDRAARPTAVGVHSPYRYGGRYDPTFLWLMFGRTVCFLEFDGTVNSRIEFLKRSPRLRLSRALIPPS